MSSVGQRKAALYLSSLERHEQHAILDELSTDAARALRPLIAQVVARGWSNPEVVQRVLAEEIFGLTSQTSLSIDALLAMAKILPVGWTARLLAANVSIDSGFIFALMEASLADRVRSEWLNTPTLPGQLKDALLAEAVASVRIAE